jgi:hypothetical protein
LASRHTLNIEYAKYYLVVTLSVRNYMMSKEEKKLSRRILVLLAEPTSQKAAQHCALTIDIHHRPHRAPSASATVQ